jgi:hypothetical protein
MEDGSNEIIVKIIVPPNSQTSFVAKDGNSVEATLRGITRELSGPVEKSDTVPIVEKSNAFTATYVSPDGEKSKLLDANGPVEKSDAVPIVEKSNAFTTTYVSPDGEKSKLLDANGPPPPYVRGGKHKVTKRHQKYYKKQLKKRSRKSKK